ncbi:type IV conjugative transfer system protein TraL [Pseudoalteromonas rubra]|uniref:Type IV conjugative transfer system protein TraL n=1 Tax=Pseudoalteromonas rubra TaxID=43658 RepID=A0A0U3IGI2_9GAMM|nr:type IV conjugative transfer system protein TraL [Pseudoalteromonas rubra]ALU46151.1 hypothetical protein AT705_24625 [Pseudoalteromonas rubra]
MSTEQDPFQYRMPKRINEPLTLIYWPIHYVMMPLAAFGFGILINKPMIMMLIGLVWFFAIKHTEEKYSRGYLVHLLWWFGFTPHLKKTRYLPDPYKRKLFQ